MAQQVEELTTGEAVGQHIKTLRKERSWSQEKLARKAELSRETIRAVEDSTNLPTLGTLLRLAEAFEMTLAEMLTPLQWAEAVGQ